MSNLKNKKPIILLCLYILGSLLWFNPISPELTAKSWHLFVIFLCTMIGIIISPMLISAIALLGGATCLVTGVLTTKQVLSGFGENVVWLLVFAFFIARGIIKTGLGKRIAFYFISKIGKTSLGLSYGLVLAEFILSPMIPSVTARGGGIIYPISQSLANAYGDHLTPSAKKKEFRLFKSSLFSSKCNY